MEVNRIYNMDCLEGMKDIPDGSIDLILTDIPYSEVNREHGTLRVLDKGAADIETFDLNTFLEQCFRVCKGVFYIFCGIEQLSLIRRFFRERGLLTRNCVWEKTNPSPMNGEHVWLSSIENCIYAKKAGAVHNEFCKSVVWRYPCGSSKIHPTQKPLNLFCRLINASTNQGMIVLDPCIGSGTTAMAAIKTGRNYIGYEIDPEYYSIAQQRIAREERQQRLAF